MMDNDNQAEYVNKKAHKAEFAKGRNERNTSMGRGNPIRIADNLYFYATYFSCIIHKDKNSFIRVKKEDAQALIDKLAEWLEM